MNVDGTPSHIEEIVNIVLMIRGVGVANCGH
jgi:hypothetical protein